MRKKTQLAIILVSRRLISEMRIWQDRAITIRSPGKVAAFRAPEKTPMKRVTMSRLLYRLLARYFVATVNAGKGNSSRQSV